MESGIKQNETKQQNKTKKQSQQSAEDVFGKTWGLLSRAPPTPPECLLCSALSFFHSPCGSHSALHAAAFPRCSGPLASLPSLWSCTPLLLNSPFTLALNHSIPNNENCLICAHVCNWKLLEARGLGFCAKRIQGIVLLLNAEKVFKFYCAFFS